MDQTGSGRPLPKKGMIRVWVTKHALSTGIFEEDVEDRGGGLVRAPMREATTYYYGEGKEWHRTWEEAVTRAEEMRLARIAKLERQLKQLNELRFEPTGTANQGGDAEDELA